MEPGCSPGPWPERACGSDLTAVRRVLGRIRRRLRLQSGLVGAVRGAVVGAAVLLAVTLGHRLDWLPAWALSVALLGALGLLVAGALLWALRPIRLLAVAGRVDRTHDLRDRLATALQFAAMPPVDGPTQRLRELAMRDAAAAVPAVELARAAPWQRPPHLPTLSALLLLVGVVSLLRLPARSAPAAVAPRPSQPALRLYVEPELIAPEREEVARLLAEAERTGDEELQELALKMQQLLDQVERGELTRKEAFDQLAALEQRLLQGEQGAVEELRERLRRAGAELGRDKLAREVGRALEKEDLERARRELEKLAQMARERAQLSAQQAQDRQRLAQALRRAAAFSGAGEQHRDQWQDRSEAERRLRREQELRDEERRLRERLEQNPQDEESARRLKRVQRELERLERERQERAEAQRELERLRRDLEQAAAELEKQLQQMTPEQRKALEQLAKDLSRLQDEIRKLQQQRTSQGQGRGLARLALGSVKQVLRRVARTSQGQGPGQGVARGQGGQGGGQGSQGKNPMKDFLERASGQGPGQNSDVLVEGDGSGDQQVMVLGEGNTPLLLPGMKQPGQAGQGPSQGRPGTAGIGQEHDPNLLGDPSRLGARLKNTRVVGKEGAGPTRSEVILGSAERGFASVPYRRVYQDYTAVAEEVMTRERVPPGYRFYVKRYFQLIKPRE